jgi:hypothetical protein
MKPFECEFAAWSFGKAPRRRTGRASISADHVDTVRDRRLPDDFGHVDIHHVRPAEL